MVRTSIARSSLRTSGSGGLPHRRQPNPFIETPVFRGSLRACMGNVRAVLKTTKVQNYCRMTDFP